VAEMQRAVGIRQGAGNEDFFKCIHKYFFQNLIQYKVHLSFFVVLRKIFIYFYSQLNSNFFKYIK
jgi:hypothetical protein